MKKSILVIFTLVFFTGCLIPQDNDITLKGTSKNYP